MHNNAKGLNSNNGDGRKNGRENETRRLKRNITAKKDDIVNMCEMKYHSSEFASDKKYHDFLVKRQEYIEETVHRNMAVHSTLITTYGLKYNEYSGDFDNVITIEELFA